MIGEIEDHKSNIPGIQAIIEFTVPRWAADEPNPNEKLEVAPIPDAEEADAFHIHSRFAGYRGPYSNAAIDPTEPIPEAHHVESLYNEQGYLADRRVFEGDTLTERERFWYDTDGRLVRRVLEDPIDENNEDEQRSYDAFGRIATIVIHYSDGSEETTMHYWSGNLDEIVTTAADESESRCKKQFDEAGRLIEYVDVDAQNGESSGEYRGYNEAGKILELGTIEPNGSRWLRELYEYNEDGMEVCWSELDAEGKTLQQKESMYENGNCVKQTLFDSSGETDTVQEFDELHRLIRSHTLGPSIESETVNVYDEQGLIAMTATRDIEDHSGFRWGGITPTASTTWWLYQFYGLNSKQA
jgi:antitoxin component YwqK of YwqJK toxin-antitoxin module